MGAKRVPNFEVDFPLRTLRAHTETLKEGWKMPQSFLEECCMSNRNVHLPPDLDDFVLTRIEGGRYSNASEMVQAALRALDREERTHEAKRAAIRAAMHGADARSIQEGDVFRKLWLAQFQPSSSL
jgi:putative addiction module CopG family antidote